MMVRFHLDAAHKFMRKIIPKDTIDIECLVEAFEVVMNAKTEHNQAKADFIKRNGHSWEFHGRDYIKKVEKSAESFRKYLEELIDKRLEEKLGPQKVKQ